LDNARFAEIEGVPGKAPQLVVGPARKAQLIENALQSLPQKSTIIGMAFFIGDKTRNPSLA
jgi:hypothetical protein